VSPTVLYCAAHGGFARESVPLGGGAAVSDRLVDEWSRTKPFDLQLLSPAILGSSAPTGKDIVRFNEREYAAFCFEFEKAVTDEVLRHDPANTVVLSNDVSEGPDFRRLAQLGFRIYTIYHVDVVAYVAAIYARSWLRPEKMVRWFDAIEATPVRRLLPGIARLIFRKQRDSVECSRGLVLPSEGMRDVLLRCYPKLLAERIHIIPWGAAAVPESDVDTDALRREYGLPDDALVVLTLSRISPEKGQDLLLEALIEWERRGDLPKRPVWVFICGEAAFMMGRRFLEKLHSLAAKLKRVRIVFPGFVTGSRKQSFFRLADVYAFPSRHESYGLTLLEALSAGLPAVCLDHHGARSVMREEFGEIVPTGSTRALLEALRLLLANDELRRRKGSAARAFAATQTSSRSAATLASLLLSQ
jgi:glycosyltransferase involved in cell wall biosynthesis